MEYSSTCVYTMLTRVGNEEINKPQNQLQNDALDMMLFSIQNNANKLQKDASPHVQTPQSH